MPPSWQTPDVPRNATTSIKRPPRQAAADEGTSRLGDFTRPIPIERRVWRRRRYALGAGLVVLVVVVAGGLALLVLPLGTWSDQDVDLQQRQAQLAELTRVNNELSAEVDRLATDDGIREAAREDYGFVEQGEQRTSILPFPALTVDVLPDEGWPYNAVTRIMAANEAGPRPDGVTASGSDGD